MSLLTLAFNKGTIIKIIDVLQTITIQITFIDKLVNNKLVMI